MEGVKNTVLVLSGKGGVGKSTVAAQMALSLQASGHRVGLLDTDLCGPSIPRMFGLDAQSVHQCPQGWVPVYTDQTQTLSVMSIGFLLQGGDDPVVWRGPKKTMMIKQFLNDVVWQELDYLIIDTPPGTSDEHIALIENLRNYSPKAVLVTTPQGVATGDVRRQVTFCKKASLNILGVIENMSGFHCPTCKECTAVFSSGGGESLAEYAGLQFLARIPLDPSLTQCAEKGQSFVEAFKDSQTAKEFVTVANKVVTSSSNNS